ncbi:Fructose-1,6-bisphosphatase class 3 [Striga asiatica]|uniref:Fructose-1,6-bisphosphatase class 3 n=1 Tax=Striga asiatica TaxID=4170 RepID=A0A5A7Q9X3_STRAF|nr:Fructose-1,6-bisphosphatase class 3 [Striga asiatica]
MVSSYEPPHGICRVEQVSTQEVENSFLIRKEIVELTFERRNQEKGGNEVIVSLHYEPRYLFEMRLISIAKEELVLVVIIVNEMKIDVRFLVKPVEFVGQREIGRQKPRSFRKGLAEEIGNVEATVNE